jgi:hypothetical protein
MSDRNLFEIAARNKFRFVTVRGNVAMEDLFDMPLTSKSGFSLDDVAKNINRQLKTTEEESFVQPATTNMARQELSDKLELVKMVIADKQAANERVRLAQEKRQRRQMLLDQLEKRNNAELEALPKEEILKQLEELDA